MESVNNAIVLAEHSSSQELVRDGNDPLRGELTLYFETIGPHADVQEGMKKKLIEEVEKIIRVWNLDEYNNRGR